MFHKVDGNDDAVSPVIGVMLMLIVTVVIAAVIAAFATGTVGDSRQTPTALLEYSGQKLTLSDDLESFYIEHKGGDVLSLHNLLVVIEPEGGPNSGIMIPLTYSDESRGKTGSLSILGKDDSVMVSAGDIISVSMPGVDNTDLAIGVIIEWTLSDIRTNGVLADGKFVVSNEEV